MNKRILWVITASILLILASFPVTIILAQVVPRADELVMATIGEPETVDPAWLYDTASATLCSNVYDTLVFFDVDRTLPRAEQGKTDVFVPSIATAYTISTDGLTYTFTIRGNVKFHNDATLTPADVEYSFERWMVQDRSGGPTWMILEPLLGLHTTREYDFPNATWAAELGPKIDAAVVSTATQVTFNLEMPYPPFLCVIAQSWAGIVNKEWCIAQGDWDPARHPLDYSAGDWTLFNDPEISPLDEPVPVMMGTGPFRFDYWSKGVEWRLKSNSPYWGGWPAAGCTANVTYVITKFIPEWSTRKMLFLAGDVDLCYVPTPHIPELITNWEDVWEDPTIPEEYVAGLRCDKELPQLVCSPCLFFNFNITEKSPYLGPGFVEADPDVIAENRIPVEFFSDMDIRKAFAYSFDFDTYCEEVYMREAKRQYIPIPEPLPYFNNETCGYKYDLTLAEQHFIAAYNGEVWDKGFSMSVTYNTGNVPREIACRMLEDAIEGLNENFHIEVVEVPWPTYLKQLVTWQLTAFAIGWLADYPDPHNFVYPFMHSHGDFTYFQRYSAAYSDWSPIIDDLVEAGIATPDDPYKETLTLTNTTAVDMANPECSKWTDGTDAYHLQKWVDGYIPCSTEGDGVLGACDYVEMNETTVTKEKKWYHVESVTVGSTVTLELEFSRKWIYYLLGQLYVEDCISVPLAYPEGRHWERDWVQGWYYNAIYPGNFYYHLWKAWSVELPEPVAMDVSVVGSITNVAGIEYVLMSEEEGVERMHPTVPFSVHFARDDRGPWCMILVAVERNNTKTGVIDAAVVDTYFMDAGEEMTQELEWDEENVPYADYNMSAYVAPVSGYVYDDALENNFVLEPYHSPITVERNYGDVDGDGDVDSDDVLAFLRGWMYHWFKKP